VDPKKLFLCREAGENWMAEAETKETLEKKIRKLRKDFQKNVQPVLRRHNYYLTKGERRRIKKKKAIKRIQRRERRLVVPKS
jgi:ribosomal protein S21